MVKMKRISFRFRWILSLTLALYSFPSCDSAGGGEVAGLSGNLAKRHWHAEILFEWIRSRGGFFSSKLEFRHVQPHDPSSRFGIFARENLAPEEILLQVPRSCWIVAEFPGSEDDELGGFKEDDEEYLELSCRLVRRLMEEIKLGDASEFSSYVDYLLAHSSGKSRLPSGWSEEGKNLFISLLHNYSKRPLPPSDILKWVDTDWKEMCNGGDGDEGGDGDYSLGERAALIVVEHNFDDILVPIYDMFRHRNGRRWLNTEAEIVPGKYFEVRTLRSVDVGEELYMSYNMCGDCGDMSYKYGTPEILRDHGFLEDYPRRWTFGSVRFDINEEPNAVGSASGNLTLSWINNPPNDRDMQFLYDAHFVMEIAEPVLKMADGHVHKDELAVIRQYYQAITEAFALAVEVVKKENEECAEVEKTCDILSLQRYDDLTEDTEELVNFGNLCNNRDFYERSIEEDYVLVDTVQSAYQTISVVHNPTTNDVCFDLDDTVQQCARYRPHYHEMMVHYTARYIPSVRRVLFVGGGDSMLLHEILKYPSLQLVVGLELDQQVTRYAFKHFGSQPHWDNNKVEWWYGDACKSLLMLPKKYFGTFDMVLVDLSETVMSFKVTDELDIMETLLLLLNSDGIMVKNELYFSDMAELFVHNAQIHFYDVPIICSQAFSLGSNSVNFLQKPLTDHNIDPKNLFIKPLDLDEHFFLVHDYEYAPDNLQKHCKEEHKKLEEELKMQKVSPGIIMIVEAENASLILQPLKKIEDNIVQALKKEGLTVVDTVHDSDNVIIVILEEGYVISHIWPVQKYCAFDIHFWSKFEKHQNVKDSLLLAVGSKNKASSSFRIVAGGMFDVRTWEGDEKIRGPQNTIPCSDIEIPPENIEVGEKSTMIDIVLEESMKIFGDGEDVVVVVCGQKESEPCRSLDLLQEKHNLDDIQVFWTCPHANEFMEDFEKILFNCELDASRALRNSLTDGKKIEAIVFDSTASYPMSQILFKIFSDFKNRLMLRKDPSVVAISLGDSKLWHSIFVNRFRREMIRRDPVYSSEVLFVGHDTNIKLNIVRVDDLFVKKIKKSILDIDNQSDFKATIYNIYGGAFQRVRGFEFSQNFELRDYDMRSSLQQWKAQKLMEQQDIFQLEKNVIGSKLSFENIKIAFKKAFLQLKSKDFSPEMAMVHDFSGWANGCIIIALWPGSRVVVLWDGRNHVDINVCTHPQNRNIAEDIKNNFISEIPSLKVVLHDFQPRGFGRVVNFLDESETLQTPHWT